tara:strand:- start:548 stop:1474 length:927 start_codon:yes stop_codon:yes gene_type:complete
VDRVLVTGGAGFIGSHLVKSLLRDANCEVVVLDDLSAGNKDKVPAEAEFHQVDISTASEEELTTLLKGCDTVFHLAAKARVQPSIKDPVSYDAVNVGGIVRLLHAAHKAGVKRLVYSGSSSCYGNAEKFPTPETHKINPLSPYGLQKYIGETYCKMFSQVYGIDTVCLRYFNVYGNGMPLTGAYRLVLGIFGSLYAERKPLTITNDGEQRRDFTWVSDVVRANILAGSRKKPFKGLSLNIGNGLNYSVNEVADMFGSKKVYGEKRYEPVQTLADNSLASSELGWIPEGDLPNFIHTYKQHLLTDSYYE